MYKGTTNYVNVQGNPLAYKETLLIIIKMTTTTTTTTNNNNHNK